MTCPVVLDLLLVLRWDDGVVSDVVLVDISELLFLLQVTPIKTIVRVHMGRLEKIHDPTNVGAVKNRAGRDKKQLQKCSSKLDAVKRYA